ncbi:MAG TPA: hypothetical protein VMZ29_10740 [Candidatus Bathyarchaeia archaeon]|nr:hypothetical protein [Candidatus Bathyarchaeia archaeon]
MNDTRSDKEINKAEGKLFDNFDYKYLISACVGLVVLITTIILIHFFKGSTTPWLEIFAYPLLIYFTFQQVLSGFGFITGYVPVAMDIINWLSKTAKKRAYNVNDIKDLEKKLADLESDDKNAIEKIDKETLVLDKRQLTLDEKLASKKGFSWLNSREQRYINKRQKELEKNKVKLAEIYEKEKKTIKSLLKEYRGKLTDLVINKQEKLAPRKFKLIMLLPLYVMLIVGLVLTLIALINPIIRWANGIEIPSLNKLDIINEWYKGIIAAYGIVMFYIVPSIRIYKDPSKEYIPRMKTYEEKKKQRFFLFRRKEKEVVDPRTLINRQFEDLRKYYWDIKQIIRKALFIPIGLSMLILAPIGGMSIVLGVKTSIRRKRMEVYEFIIQIIIAIGLIILIVPTYFTFFSRFLKISIHPIITIIIKLIYGSFLIYSFVIFTKRPIARMKEDNCLEI